MAAASTTLEFQQQQPSLLVLPPSQSLQGSTISINASNSNLSPQQLNVNEQRKHQTLLEIVTTRLKKYGVCILAGILMLDTLLMILLLFLSSLGNTLLAIHNSSVGNVTKNNQLRCRCPLPVVIGGNNCSIINAQGNVSISELLAQNHHSMMENETFEGTLSDGENKLTDCHPVWPHGYLRRVFICKYLSTQANDGGGGGGSQSELSVEQQFIKMRKNLLLLNQLNMGGTDRDYQQMLDEFEKWKNKYSKYLDNLTNVEQGDSNQQRREYKVVGGGGNINMPATDTAAVVGMNSSFLSGLSDLRPLIRAVEVVLSGSACLMSERQYRDLIRQAPWVDLELFTQKVIDEQQTERDNTKVEK